jgi:hypothetical protein
LSGSNRSNQSTTSEYFTGNYLARELGMVYNLYSRERLERQ